MNEVSVLIVDDEPLFVSQLSLFLESRGMKTFGTTDVEAGLRILKHEKIAVILADQKMPGIKGVELLEKVEREHPEVIRVLITGYSDISVVVDAVNRGAIYRYIPKKLLPDEIALVVKQCLQKYHQDQELHRLSQANHRLLRKLSAEENLSVMGIFGHEISQKLEEIILGLSGYLFREAGRGDQKKVTGDFKFLDYSLRRIRELSSMAQNVTQEGRVSSVHSVIEKELIALEKKAREANLKVAFETDLDPALASLSAHEKSLRYLFKELFENAALFSTGPTRVISIGSRRIPEEEDPRAEIFISNSWKNDSEDPQRFLAPFYTSLGRVDSPGEMQTEFSHDYNLTPHFHFGIGLPLARWIAASHGGELLLKASANRLTAAITLPFSGI